jgi:predicted house-cleaning noncanonical NTP pyrophosphatase (MazG superfamily)
MTRYDKLVRDKIPDNIARSGTKCKYHTIRNNKEFLEKLYEKINEEIGEFKENPSVEEFSDIMEVLESIAKYHMFDLEEIKVAKKGKKVVKGGFDKRIFLEYTE